MCAVSVTLRTHTMKPVKLATCLQNWQNINRSQTPFDLDILFTFQYFMPWFCTYFNFSMLATKCVQMKKSHPLFHLYIPATERFCPFFVTANRVLTTRSSIPFLPEGNLWNFQEPSTIRQFLCSCFCRVKSFLGRGKIVKGSAYSYPLPLHLWSQKRKFFLTE